MTTENTIRTLKPCPNKINHVSAWAGWGRKLCDFCHKIYVHTEETK